MTGLLDKAKELNNFKSQICEIITKPTFFWPVWTQQRQVIDIFV